MKRNALLTLAFFLLCHALFGQVNTAPMPLPVPQFFSATGQPLAGGKIFTFSAGTSTPLATYTDGTGTVQNSNPILLNAGGFPTNASGSIVGIWLGPQKYKIILQNSFGVQQWLIDQVGGNNLFSLANLNVAESIPPSCNIGSDILWGDSAEHRFRMCNNNGSPDDLIGANTVDILSNKTLITPHLTNPIETSPTVSGTETHTGIANFIGTVSSCKQNGVFYVGDPCAAVWGGGDIGAQINAAYAALPAPGGAIGIIPKTSGACYDFSTPVVLASLGKYPRLEWEGANGFLGVSGYQNCLNYTPTSGVAITLDYATSTGIPAASAHGISRLLLVNNGCTSFGGCGGSAVGINSGLSNVGDSEAHYEDLSMEGWNIAYQNLGTASHFGVIFDNPNFVNNNTGFMLESPAPIIISRGVFAGNTSVFKTNNASASPGIWLTSPDIFNNNTVMDATGSVSPAIGVFHCVICHLEASTSAQTPFISGAIDVQLLGGVAEVDTAGGTVNSFFNVSGYYFESDMEMLTAATTTNILVAASATTKGKLNGIIFGSNFGATYVSGAGANNIDLHLSAAGALPDIPTYFTDFATPLKFNAVALIGKGFPAQVATVDLTAQTAAITTTTLYAVPATGAGQYRLGWNAKVTTAAGTSSTLGALTIVYTDPDGVVQTITAPASVAAGTIATTAAGNTTATVLLGLPLMLNCKASSNITYAFAYASNAASAMNYNLHLKLEAQ